LTSYFYKKCDVKVTELCPILSGTSDNGNSWEKQTVVFETLSLEPQVLAVGFMGERKTQQTKALHVGQNVELNFAIRCREYNGMWYTQLDGISVKPMEVKPQDDASSSPDGEQQHPDGEQTQMDMHSEVDYLPY